MVGPEHPADRRYIAVQAGDGDRHRPLQDEARRRLERVRAAIEAELDAATAIGDTERRGHATEQLRAIEEALGRHDEQLQRSDGPAHPHERRDAHRGRSVDA